MNPNCQSSTDKALAQNILFQLVMEDKEIFSGLLTLASGRQIFLNNDVETEKSIVLDTKKKGIRLDVSAVDGNGTVYDLEMENKGENLIKRLRYYQAVMNSKMLSRGDDYSEIKATKIIVVCSFDPKGDNLYKYCINRVYSHEPNMPIADDETIILLNSKGKYGDLPDELKEFLMMVNGIDETTFSKLKTDFGKKVYIKIIEILNRERKKEGTMTGLWFECELMDSRSEGRREGRQEGKQEGISEMMEVQNMYKSGYTEESIAESTGVSPDDVAKMVAILKN